MSAPGDRIDCNGQRLPGIRCPSTLSRRGCTVACSRRHGPSDNQAALAWRICLSRPPLPPMNYRSTHATHLTSAHSSTFSQSSKFSLRGRCVEPSFLKPPAVPPPPARARPVMLEKIRQASLSSKPKRFRSRLACVSRSTGILPAQMPLQVC